MQAAGRNDEGHQIKTISVQEAKSDLQALLKAAQNVRVVLTKAGRPSAIVIGIESYDDEDLASATSAEFWQMIEQRRKGPSISLSELKKRLTAKKASNAKKKTSAGIARSGKHKG